VKNSASRIGIFGGTFDPPHVGHLIIAEQAREQLSLDKVLFVPAHVPPHKKGSATASPHERLTMTKRALVGIPAFQASSIEIGRKGVSYTVDTLRQLTIQYRKAKLFLIVGGDNFTQFGSWKSSDEILRLATPAVYSREGSLPARWSHHRYHVVRLRGALLNISSTLIRQRLKNGESIRFLVPPSVERYIKLHKLYT